MNEKRKYNSIYLWLNPILNTPTLVLLSMLNIYSLLAVILILINILISRLLYMRKRLGVDLTILMNSIYILMSPVVIFLGPFQIDKYNELYEITLWFSLIAPLWYSFNLLYYTALRKEHKEKRVVL